MTNPQDVTDPMLLRYGRLAAANAPESVGFQLSLSPQAVFHIGHIIAQWGTLQQQIDFEISMRGRVGVPDHIVKKSSRYEAKYKLQYLKEAAPYFLAEKREGALNFYLRNLNQISRHKSTRDALAHGTYTEQDNKNSDVVCVNYKIHKLRYSLENLTKVSREISNCITFFFTFWEWADAPAVYAMLTASLEK